MSNFNHNVKADDDGRHPVHKHLVMFEIEQHHGMYILTAVNQNGSALISADDAVEMFGEQYNDEFAYLTDEYLKMLEQNV